MSVEDEALAAVNQLYQISGEAKRIAETLAKVLDKVAIGTIVISMSEEDKVKVLDWYKSHKKDLEDLVKSLP